MAPRRFRRRFLVAAIATVAVLVSLGFGLGTVIRGSHRGPWGTFPPGQDRRGPWWPLGLAAFVFVVGGVATKRAYRRLGGPVGDLLGAAERLGQGDYDVRVTPGGPRELRLLADTINDVAVRLAASEEQRRRFLADVTHELRTPLAVLQSGLEAQIDGIHPRDDRHLASLLEETQLLGRLVGDLHTLALADAGRLALHYEPTHPSALVADAIESQATLAARKGVAVVSSVADGLPEIEVDPTRIRQVLANLLSNALRHTPSGGEVSVRVESTDGGPGVGFVVVDSGPGFAADSLTSVFDRFTRSADSRGSGLGLSIARDLVVAHGGTITAANADEGAGGAVIGFTLPVQRGST
jgi:two-component system OmpR family sensor kinase/two-component system sensor histidine kinase BaeS